MKTYEWLQFVQVTLLLVVFLFPTSLIQTQYSCSWSLHFAHCLLERRVYILKSRLKFGKTATEIPALARRLLRACLTCNINTQPLRCCRGDAKSPVRCKRHNRLQ